MTLKPAAVKYLRLDKQHICFLTSILAITFIGLLVRIYKLGVSPTGFFADEAAIGLHAYHLFTTGKDYNGVSHPLFFYSFGVYRNPIPIYLTVPSVAIFGLNEFSTRLPFAIIGTLTVPLSSFVAYQLKIFDKKSWNRVFAMFTALFISTSPWHIHFSRFASENIYLPFFITLSFAIFLCGLGNKKLLLVSFLFFGLTMYTYYPAWVVVPIFLVGICFFYKNILLDKSKYFFISTLTFLVSTLPLLVSFANGSIFGRWNQVKTVTSVPGIIKAYLAHFSPDFLFFRGDIDYPGHFITRFSSRGTGELYPFQLPLVLVGLIFLATKVKNQGALLLFFLLLLYPLGGTLANSDGGGAISWRSILGTLPLNVIAAVGATSIAQRAKFFARTRALGVWVTIFFILTATLFSFGKYMWEYHAQYPTYSSDFWGWQYGPRDIMKNFLQNRERYDQMIFYGSFNSPEIFVKFYDPENICKGKCSAGDMGSISTSKRQLWAIGVDKLQEIPLNKTLALQKVLYYPNQRPAFFIGTISH